MKAGVGQVLAQGELLGYAPTCEGARMHSILRFPNQQRLLFYFGGLPSSMYVAFDSITVFGDARIEGQTQEMSAQYVNIYNSKV
jgi:hypothetical protein